MGGTAQVLFNSQLNYQLTQSMPTEMLFDQSMPTEMLFDHLFFSWFKIENQIYETL